MGSPIPQPLKNVATLDRVAGFAPAQIEALAGFWIISVQEFLAVLELPRGRESLKAILGVGDDELAALQLSAGEIVGPERSAARLEQEAMKADYRLGALQPPADDRDASYDGVAYPGSLPAIVDYSPQLPPVRDQGIRSTCVAYAAAAVREFLEIRTAQAAPGAINLSEQFIYWWCKQHDNLPKVAGTYPHLGLACLFKAGTVTEGEWPYREDLIPDNESHGPPPSGAEEQAWRYRVKRVIRLEPHDVQGMKTALAAGKAILFAIPVYDSWFRARTARAAGKINLPLPGEPANGLHAMALVGYVDDEAAPGGGYFLVRNSWSPWGFDSPFPGCGTICYEFIARHNTTAVTGDRMSPADVYVRNAEQDRGDVPRQGLVCNSPDLWVRHAADEQPEHQMPEPYKENSIYVRAWNQGPEIAQRVTATIYQAMLSTSLWPNHWQPVGEVELPTIAAGASVVGVVKWTPPSAGPYSLMVKLSSPADPVQPGWWVREDNNAALKSLVVVRVPAGGRARFQFPMFGPPGLLGAMDLAVDREGFPRGRVELGMKERHAFAGSRLREDVVQLDGLAGFATASETITVTIAPDAGAQPGERGEIVLTQHYGSLLVGQVVVQVEVVQKGA